MHVVIFEGSRWPSFAPLSLSRPVFLLRSGLSTLIEKQIRWMKPTRLTLWVRPGLAQWCRRELSPAMGIPCSVNEPLDAEPAVLVNGRSVLFGPLEIPAAPSVCVDEGDLIRTALVQAPGLSPDDCLRRTDAWLRILDLPRHDTSARLPSYLWDLIGWNQESIVADVAALGQPATHPTGPYHIVNGKSLFVGPDVTLEPGCVLDASNGPIVLDRSATVGANAVLKGPCCVGRDSQIMPLSFIRPGTSVGPNCRVGGEVSNAVFVANSNKGHDGFIGDSYLGEWVNFGAGTNTSNLKNTYGMIRVHIGSRKIQTRRQFLGSLVGDHSKTGIGTRLTSGSYVGYCSLIAASGIPSPFTPSFSFVTDKGAERYRLEKARQVMSQVYARRGRTWGDADEMILKYAGETSPLVEQG